VSGINKSTLLIISREFFFVMAFAMVFLSMCAVASIPFFINLKLLIIFALCKLLSQGMYKLRILVSEFSKYIYIIIPCAWGILYGAWNENYGVMNELPLYGYAMLSYLIVFAALSLQKNILAVLEFSVKASSLMVMSVFFYVYFSRDSELAIFLSKAIVFLIQNPQGYLKIHSIQTTSLLFLCPVMLGFYYFKKSIFNGFVLVILVLMLLLSGRRSATILLMLIIFLLAIYTYMSTRSIISLVKFVAPITFSFLMFIVFVNHIEPGTTGGGLAGSVSDAFAIVDIEKIAEKSNVNFKKNNANYRKRKHESVGDNDNMSESKVEQLATNMCSFDVYSKAGVDPGKIGAAIRQSQASILMEEINSSLLFGKGFGFVIETCIRSEAQPWRFELTYLSLILNVGIVGFLMLVFTYCMWIKKSIAIIHNRNVAYSLLGGSLFFIVCSSTNPYLLSVENVWIFFIPYLLSLIADCKNTEVIN
jgi:hypothetical protein